MQFANLVNYIAIAVYVSAWVYLLLQVRQKTTPPKPVVITLAVVALIFHGLNVDNTVFNHGGFHFGVFKLPSLFFWVMNLLVLISGIRKPLYNLYLFLFPLAALTVLSATLSDSAVTTRTPALLHILLAALAYGFLTIATLQALLLAYQNHQLKHKQMTGVVSLLPPLQTMESLMFELLWVGQVLLTLLIISGIALTEDLFEQQQAHTMAFSLMSWAIYAVLLWGRTRLGWRGNTAIRWTLGGFVCLLLAYFGTQLVYQVILSNGAS